METYEYIAEILSDGHLSVPDNLKDKLKEMAQVKVMLLIGDEESDWKNFTMSQFLKGYSEKDAIYDDL
ncbi:MAG: hypothetical protein HY879_25445 [Deltaproteobacteria bacterium]|nr:hypothetical protein [Deltaproteobacteria bacterium]